MNRRIVRIAVSVLLCFGGFVAVEAAEWDDDDDAQFARVLLLSIDGLHASDLDWYVANRPDSTLATLTATGRTYARATATRPSDSFPGLLAMVTGGSPRSTGVYYDDGYDRALAPALNPVPVDACVGGVPGPGAHVQWKQNLDAPQTAPFVATIDPTKLPLDPMARTPCSQVAPHAFPRINNVFELVRRAGGRTAWSDKHPAYEFLMGPSGRGVDDLFTPEIVTTVSGVTVTNSFAATMAYDDMKVAAILHEIDGLDHTGLVAAPVPALFGMNFQAVSVGQKLKTEQLLGVPTSGMLGGYTRVNGVLTPSEGLVATLDHTDQSIGQMVAELTANRLLGSTLIIISAKHGNSPMETSTLVRANPAVLAGIVNGVQPGLLAQLSADTGPLIWLKDQSKTAAVVDALKAADPALTRIDASQPGDGVLWGQALASRYADPLRDNRVPDIVLLPLPGTVYTTSSSKIADHGGFGDEDVHVALLVSNPRMFARTIDDAVETRQIACTIVTSLGIDCDRLQSERLEPSRALPRRNHGGGDNDDR